MNQVFTVVLTAVVFVSLGVGAMFGLWMSGDDGDYVLDEPIGVTVSFDFGDGTEETYDLETVNATVYGALLDTARPERANLTVKTTYWASFDSILVDTIGHRTGGDDGKYWIYYVNGDAGMVGADRYRLDDGDHVEWRFEGYG